MQRRESNDIIIFMGKVAQPPRAQRHPHMQRGLNKLRDQRRQIAVRLAKLDAEISKISTKSGKKAMSPSELEKWFEEMTAGLQGLPPLPADFSRADLYSDDD